MNKSILSKVFIFAAGAAIGSVVTWKFVKTKYEQIANEEIKSVKETYSRRAEELEETSDFSHVTIARPLDTTTTTISTDDCVEATVENMVHIVNRYNYANPTDKKEDKDMFEDKPYVIPPDEFGELDDYNTVSLTYYADGTLTDEDDEPIDDIEEIIGEDSLNHFGEYEEDSVFVRNDALRTDYEILKDVRRYCDI